MCRASACTCSSTAVIPITASKGAERRGAASHPKYHPLTVVAIVAGAVVVLGGGSFFGALFITQQQQFGRLSQVGAAHPNASASASASAAETAARSAAASDLKESIASGEAAYTASDGHVRDEALRTSLRSALDAGKAALADASSTAADLRSAKAAIDQAAAAVLAAHTANWNDINGKWCDSHGCITIAGLQNTGDGSTYVHDRGQDSHGCLWGVASGQQDVFVTLCPQGDAFVDPAEDCGTPEDVTRDRLYVRQYCAEPYYRG